MLSNRRGPLNTAPRKPATKASSSTQKLAGAEREGTSPPLTNRQSHKTGPTLDPQHQRDQTQKRGRKDMPIKLPHTPPHSQPSAPSKWKAAQLWKMRREEI